MQAQKPPGESAAMEVSVIVPVYNNADILVTTLSDLESYLTSHFRDYEILFVDDGSRDGSASIVRMAESRNERIRLLSHGKNLGQQKAIATGMMAAAKDIAIGIDADLPCSLNSILKLASAAATGTELVLGKRLLREPRVWWRRLGSSLGNLMFRMLFPYEIEDSGCSTAAVRRSLIEKFKESNPNVLLIKPQLLALATNYAEIYIDPPTVFRRKKSSYSAFALAKLLGLMVLCRFANTRRHKTVEIHS